LPDDFRPVYTAAGIRAGQVGDLPGE